MKYKIYYQENSELKIIKLEANSISKLSTHINYPANVISIKEDLEYSFDLFENQNEKLEMFYEMKTMLDSNLEFEYIVDILLKSNFNKKNKEVLVTIKESIKNGQNIYESLKIHKNYLQTSLVFFKIANENSNIKECIEALYTMQIKEQKIKSSIKSLLTYPLILLGSVFFTIYILFTYVIPKFQNIYVQFGDNLPLSTKILLDIKYFLDNNYLLIGIVFFSVIILIKFIYDSYKYKIDRFIFYKIPVFSMFYKNIVFYRLFLSLSLQINSKELFSNALQNSIDIVNNNYLKSKLQYILKDIKNGKSIYYAFEKTKSFDMFTLRLLHTAQVSNKQEEMMQSIVKIYDSNISKNIKKFKTIFEPLMIFILSSIILWLVLAIMTPIWDLSSVIK